MTSTSTTSSSLNVIALISGGKDSLFSILHCLRNGHKVVALANLRPSLINDVDDDDDMQDDIDSFMYQTIGHSTVPLYSQALSLPLYRQPIIGSAVNTDKSYSHISSSSSSTFTFPSSTADGLVIAHENKSDDETESLVPLLQRIMQRHPEANAVSSGAILSTYQRTRIESVCLNLGITPLSYLWQFPLLPPYTQTSLLEDMYAVGMDARIVKVASGGLDDTHLWMNITDASTIQKLKQSMKRFGGDLASGEILGEGGEFETLALDGPWPVWTHRLLVSDADKSVPRRDGGSWAVQITKAKLEKKHETEHVWAENLRVPSLYDDEFSDVLQQAGSLPSFPIGQITVDHIRFGRIPCVEAIGAKKDKLYIANISDSLAESTVKDQVTSIVATIRIALAKKGLSPDDIIFTTIVLRRMSDFAAINKAYCSLFTQPNPPARVTVSCGDLLPQNVQAVISILVEKRQDSRMRGLHVQSRSYWTPANIGPYSQAIPSSIGETMSGQEIVYVAGQIPLEPGSMELQEGSFTEQAVLSLQHLWRIGREMGVTWWTSGLAFIPSSSREAAVQKAQVIGRVWGLIHRSSTAEKPGDAVEGEVEVDIAEKNLRQPWSAFRIMSDNSVLKTIRRPLPDWDKVESLHTTVADTQPPCFTLEVEELPRNAPVEWYSVGVKGTVILHRCAPSENYFEISTCTVKDTSFSVTTVAITQKHAVEGMEWEAVMSEVRQNVDPACMVKCEIFTTLPVPEEVVESLCAAVIPCRSIWSSAGDAVNAVVRLETH